MLSREAMVLLANSIISASPFNSACRQNKARAIQSAEGVFVTVLSATENAAQASEYNRPITIACLRKVCAEDRGKTHVLFEVGEVRHGQPRLHKRWPLRPLMHAKHCPLCPIPTLDRQPHSPALA
eukprot:1535914-Rhodomonas_salina.2